MNEDLETYYLESFSLDDLKAKENPFPQWLVIHETQIKKWPYNKFLYQWAGARWRWEGKLTWTDQKWSEWVERDQMRTWVMYDRGTPAGYFELEKQQNDVEIAIFGLTPPFLDKGYGGFLLTQAIRWAWDWQAQRVWVHTCNRDHPYALSNYQSRGLTLYKTEYGEPSV